MNPEESEGSKPRKLYTEEFKRSVVDHWMSSGKPAAMVAKEFGLNIWNLRDWKRRYHSVAKPADGDQTGVGFRPRATGLGSDDTRRVEQTIREHHRAA